MHLLLLLASLFQSSLRWCSNISDDGFVGGLGTLLYGEFRFQDLKAAFASAEVVSGQKLLGQFGDTSGVVLVFNDSDILLVVTAFIYFAFDRLKTL